MNSDLRDALKAAKDALDLPYAATAGGDEIRAGLIESRVMLVNSFLKAVLEDAPTLDLDFEIRFLAERIAKQPGEYVTHDQARAAMAQGATWIDAVTLPDPTQGEQQ